MGVEKGLTERTTTLNFMRSPVSRVTCRQPGFKASWGYCFTVVMVTFVMWQVPRSESAASETEGLRVGLTWGVLSTTSWMVPLTFPSWDMDRRSVSMAAWLERPSRDSPLTATSWSLILRRPSCGKQFPVMASKLKVLGVWRRRTLTPHFLPLTQVSPQSTACWFIYFDQQSTVISSFFY